MDAAVQVHRKDASFAYHKTKSLEPIIVYGSSIAPLLVVLRRGDSKGAGMGRSP